MHSMCFFLSWLYVRCVTCACNLDEPRHVYGLIWTVFNHYQFIMGMCMHILLWCSPASDCYYHQHCYYDGIRQQDYLINLLRPDTYLNCSSQLIFPRTALPWATQSYYLKLIRYTLGQCLPSCINKQFPIVARRAFNTMN